MAAVTFRLDDADVDRIARRVVEMLGEREDAEPGYMPPARAAEYLGVKRRRLYDLTSARAIEPDGHDGRTPLFTRQTLDRYVCDSDS